MNQSHARSGNFLNKFLLNVQPFNAIYLYEHWKKKSVIKFNQEFLASSLLVVNSRLQFLFKPDLKDSIQISEAKKTKLRLKKHTKKKRTFFLLPGIVMRKADEKKKENPEIFFLLPGITMNGR